MPPRAALPALTALRFPLALWVVLLHGEETTRRIAGSGFSPPMNLLRTGYMAVAVFFVLSGFVLAYNYHDRVASSAERWSFWRARCARIYPVYLFAACAFLPIALFKAWQETHDVGAALRACAAPFVCALALVQSWHPDFALAWNPPSWSVSTEAFFYLTCPFVLMSLRSWSAKGLVITIIACLALSLLPPLILVVYPLPEFSDLPAAAPPAEARSSAWEFVIRFHPLVRWPEFLAGTALGMWFVRQRLSSTAALGAMFLGGGGLLAFAILASPHVSFPLAHNGLAALLAVPLVAGLAQVDWPHDSRGKRLLLLLGEASYAMYLLQWPTRLVLKFVEQRGWAGSLPPATLLVAYVGGTILAGIIVHRLLEVPARRWLRG